MSEAPPSPGGFARRLRALVRKEVRQLLRDRSNIAFGLLLPLTLILLFGYGISMDVPQARVAMVLDDRSPQVNDVLSGLRLSPWIREVPAPTMAAAARAMDEGRADAILHVPDDFSSALAAGDARVQLILHGSDAASARAIEAYVQGGLASWTRKPSLALPIPATLPLTAGAGRVTLEPRMWFNDAQTSTWYLVPGLIALIMTLVGAFLTSLVVAREWERGTMEALLVTPVHPIEILLSKMVPYFALGLVGLALCLAAARWLFAVPFEGSFLLIVLACVLYLLAALGLGLLISSTTRNQFLASQVALVASFMPALMLSGFLFDLRNVPRVVSVIGHALPATHFLELLKTLLLVGNVPAVVVPEFAVLAGYALAFVAAARLVTRKRLPA